MKTNIICILYEFVEQTREFKSMTVFIRSNFFIIPVAIFDEKALKLERHAKTVINVPNTPVFTNIYSKDTFSNGAK